MVGVGIFGILLKASTIAKMWLLQKLKRTKAHFFKIKKKFLLILSRIP